MLTAAYLAQYKAKPLLLEANQPRSEGEGHFISKPSFLISDLNWITNYFYLLQEK